MSNFSGRRATARRIVYASLAAGMAVLLNTHPARAGDIAEPGFTPRMEGKVLFEIQSDNNVESDDPDAELSDTFNTTEATVAWHLFPGFSVQSLFVLEPVEDPTGDRFFGDHGLFAEELYAQYERGPFRLFGGKFNAPFGKAWDAAPGIYGVDFAEDYELVEKVGFGAGISQKGTPFGKLALTAAVFQADASGLSNSAFTNRGKTDCDDGGPSNTCSLESFAVALDGSEIPGLPGIGFKLGYTHQAAGEGDPEDQNGYAATLTGAHTWNGVGIAWIAESVYLDSFAGLFDDPVDEIWYHTLGVTFSQGSYNLSLSYTARPAELSDGTDFEDQQFQVSAGKKFGGGWTFDAGYKYHVEEDVENHTVGVLLTRTVSFNTAR